MINEDKIDNDFSGSTLLEEDTEDNYFVFEIYVKKFGHPAIYKIREKDRKYVFEVVKNTHWKCYRNL